MGTGSFDSNVQGTPAVSATATSCAVGVAATSDNTPPDFCVGTNGAAVSAIGTNGAYGVNASSDSETAVLAAGQQGPGIDASSYYGAGAYLYSYYGTGAYLYSEYGTGANISSEYGTGVLATSSSGIGMHAVGGGASPTTPPIPQAAIFAEGGPGSGVYATSDSGTGVSGTTESGIGVTANGGSEGVALQVIGKVEVQGNSVGSVTMTAGTKTLTVNNTAATTNSLILLTPLNNPQAFLWIGARHAGSFTIDASKALPTKVTIMFLIIN